MRRSEKEWETHRGLDLRHPELNKSLWLHSDVFHHLPTAQIGGDKDWDRWMAYKSQMGQGDMSF